MIKGAVLLRQSLWSALGWILPALAAGRVVISDRFLWSTAVYQSVSSSLSPGEILRLARWAAPGLKVTRTFLIDMDPRAALRRVKDRNRMEDRGLDYQRRVRNGFLALARKFREDAAIVDGRGTPEEVHRRVTEKLPSRGWSRCSSP